MSTWRCMYCETINEDRTQAKQRICAVCGKPAPIVEEGRPKHQAKRPSIPEDRQETARVQEEPRIVIPEASDAERPDKRHGRKRGLLFVLFACVGIAAVCISGYYLLQRDRKPGNEQLPMATITTEPTTEPTTTRSEETEGWVCPTCGETRYKNICPKDGTAQPGAADEAVTDWHVGDIVTMGEYGGEAVEWLVLADEGDTRTLIAVKGQDAVCFNKSSIDGNKWETSYIRTWLNETYYNTAFSAEEQTLITAGPTGDKVWLLSVDEAKQYFVNDDARVCYPTAYAKNNGAGTNNVGAGWWWLRSTSSSTDYAAYVSGIGDIRSHSFDVYYDDVVVRPAVVVALGLLN